MLTICQDKDARRLQLILAQRPSLLRTVCDEMGGLEMETTMTAPNPSRQDRRHWKWTKQTSYCSCATLTPRRIATYSTSRVDFFKNSVESRKHSITCPLYIGTETTATVGFKMAYYGKLLANTVKATISITSGAGGYSINPGLRFGAVVPYDSPAFVILELTTFPGGFTTTSPSQSKEVADYFKSALQRLYELFQDGRASPTDTSEFGENLLHVISTF